MKLIQKAIKSIISEGLLAFLKRFTSYIKYRYKYNVKRNIYYIRLKYYILHRLDGYTAIANPFKIVYIPPETIKLKTFEFGKWESVGLISDGEWDKRTKPVTCMKKYQAVNKHFCKNMSWEETGIIDYLYYKISKKGVSSVDGCKSKKELKKRYKRIDGLYIELQEEGYKEQKHDIRDSIAVHVGRNGEFLFAGSGCHRLFLSKILGLNEVPVWIRARHEQWQKIRDEVASAQSTDELSDRAKSYVDHPDMQDIVENHS